MSLFNAYLALSGAYDAKVLRDEPLSHHTSYRIGGPADLLISVHSYEALRNVLAVLVREHVDWVILGKGSNVLAADAGYRGCVIELAGDFTRATFSEDGHVTVGAGMLLSKLVLGTLKRSLSGLEFCTGVPGTVGGAISMDAGSRHEWIGQRVESLVLTTSTGKLYRRAGSDVDWGYRRTSLDPSSIILEADLALTPGDKDAIAAEMNRRIARRRRTQPMGQPSCGSVFKNPPDASVGRMIEECGLKGTQVGGAQISLVHANFIVNKGGAKAADVAELIRLAHDSVLDKFGVDLACEVKFLGFGA